MALAACTSSEQRKEVDYSCLVNPFIGTDFTGNTYPGAQFPFGMVQLSPDNGLPGWDRIAGYYYPDSTIAGLVIRIYLVQAPEICMTYLSCRSLFRIKKQMRLWGYILSFLIRTKRHLQATIRFGWRIIISM